MKKQIVTSVAVIGAVAAVAVGGTMALFSDSETSNGNIFTAGAIDLKVDHTKATYDGEPCVGRCAEVGSDLIVNGGFEEPDVAHGSWGVFASINGWTSTGAGIEVQDHAAGNPHTGHQLVELDSHGQVDNRSSMSQAIATVPGGKYRLHFWYSPRPNNGPAGDNKIDYLVKVTSGGGTIVTGSVGADAVGGSNTNWVEYVYDFIAVDNSTTIQFTDTGSEADTLGGYLDDVSVFALECTETGFPYGGICHLWNEKNLGESDHFWNFPDVKPGDWGTNVISLHVTSNDAFVCMSTDGQEDMENDLVNPEVNAGDNTPGVPVGENGGELSKYLKVVVWEDDNDGVHQSGEDVLYSGLLKDLATEKLVLPTSSTGYIGLAWCAGDQTVNPDGSIDCDGSGDQDDAQTDSFVSDVVFTAVQQRNNGDFFCPGTEPVDQKG